MLYLCRGDRASGWVVDEQADGLGMAFGADDVPLLTEHAECCVGGAADLQIEGYSAEDRPIPVRIAHVTRQSKNLVCRERDFCRQRQARRKRPRDDILPAETER